jgi:hypothetical protein
VSRAIDQPHPEFSLTGKVDCAKKELYRSIVEVIWELFMRIQIVVDDTYKSMLDELKLITGLTQWQDLFSDAITMFNWGVQQRLQGRIVTSMDEREENYRELQMPSLERAAAYAKIRKATSTQASTVVSDESAASVRSSSS